MYYGTYFRHSFINLGIKKVLLMMISPLLRVNLLLLKQYFE